MAATAGGALGGAAGGWFFYLVSIAVTGGVHDAGRRNRMLLGGAALGAAFSLTKPNPDPRCRD